MIKKIEIYFIIILFACCFISCSKLNAESKTYQIVYLDTLSFVAANSCYEYLNTNGINNFVSISNKSNGRKDKIAKSIFFKINPKLKSDVTFLVNENNITLTAKDSKSLAWLGFQFLKKQSIEDSNINSDDLPPSIIEFEKLKDFSFSFKYREPYFQPNLNEINSHKLGTHNLENEWAIWGHNVARLFKQKNTPIDCFSLVGTERNKEQFCFSSENTFKLISNYIIDNFGKGSNTNKNNFTIAPSDNEIVCSCNKCKSIGNTKTNAAPAVLSLIERLAKKYPNHSFFTIDYSSVSAIKRKKLPKNTGVFISSIDFIMKPTFHESKAKELKEFESKIENWKKLTNSIYVWDYSVNFDDYLTPFPNLFYSQKQFQYYNKIGISGVFCNGSGEEYSVFQDLKTYVLASLLINPDLELESLINKFYSQYYPKTGSKFFSYIIELEETFMNSNKSLNIYGSVNQAFNNYMNPEKLNEFCDYLDENNDVESSYEEENLKKTRTSLAFTQLQKGLYFKTNKENGYLTQSNDTKSINPVFLKNYKKLESNFEACQIMTFNERGGKIKNYLTEIDKYILSKERANNILLNTKLNFKSKLDEGYTNTSILTDGIFGLPIDYHLNWMFITTDDIVFELPTIEPKTDYSLECSFLCDKKLKLYPPTKIEIFEDEKLLSSKNIDFVFTEPSKYLLKINFNPLKGNNLKIKITRNEKFNKVACDEIVLQK